MQYTDHAMTCDVKVNPGMQVCCVCVLDLNSDIMIVITTVPPEPELSCITKKCSHFVRDVLYV